MCIIETPTPTTTITSQIVLGGWHPTCIALLDKSTLSMSMAPTICKQVPGRTETGSNAWGVYIACYTCARLNRLRSHTCAGTVVRPAFGCTSAFGIVVQSLRPEHNGPQAICQHLLSTDFRMIATSCPLPMTYNECANSGAVRWHAVQGVAIHFVLARSQSVVTSCSRQRTH